MTATNARPVDGELLIERRFEAPRALVFAAWTDRNHLVQWSCPRDMTLSAVDIEADIVQAGAPYRICMTDADGTEHWLSGVYRDVVAQSRLSYTAAWEDDAGQRGHETLVTVTFEDAGTGTKLTLHQTTFLSEDARDGHRQGWDSTLDHLDAYLAALV